MLLATLKEDIAARWYPVARLTTVYDVKIRILAHISPYKNCLYIQYNHVFPCL